MWLKSFSCGLWPYETHGLSFHNWLWHNCATSVTGMTWIILCFKFGSLFWQLLCRQHWLSFELAWIWLVPSLLAAWMFWLFCYYGWFSCFNLIFLMLTTRDFAKRCGVFVAAGHVMRSGVHLSTNALIFTWCCKVKWFPVYPICKNGFAIWRR